MSRALHFNDIVASRRAVLGGLIGAPLLNLAGCATPTPSAPAASASGFTPIAATNADTISLPLGYSWRTLIAWGDALFDTVAPTFDPDALTRAEQEQRFGQNNDMLALFPATYAFPPLKNEARMILCANNEYATPDLMYPALAEREAITPAQVEALYAAVGVSVVELERGAQGWRTVKNAAPGAGKNRRITPFTPVLFSGPGARHPWIVEAARIVNEREPSRGDAPAGAVRCGTLANCGGGYTPWGTYLTAEENFEGFFAGSDRDLNAARNADGRVALDQSSHGYPSGAFPAALAPRQFRIGENPHGPALYGWVTEIDPYDVASTPKKRTALGRVKHECATTALAADGRCVVYMGDDQRDEHVYKFVSRARFNVTDRRANMDLLDEGQLYCAQFDESGQGRWLAITLDAANAAAEREESSIRFADEADLLMRVRDAARFMGATPMDRPEDIEAVCDAHWRGLGPVLIVCTNNAERGFEHPGSPRRESERPQSAQANLAGHILRIDEAGGDCAAESFTWDVFVMGGDPDATALTAPTRAGNPAHISNKHNGAPTTSGDRFACPDNIFIDSTQQVWIATDGNDGVFADCNDCVVTTSVAGDGPRAMKRFLVGPMGGEICGPMMTPDETAFLCSIQHPGANDVAGVDYSQLRWLGEPPTSHFPDGGDAWPRSAVVIVTRDDGGRIGD
jgi:secreted PhoX family phosphatase